MSEKKEFKHESLEDLESILKYLDEIRNGLKEGTLRLGTEEREVVLQPGTLSELVIKAKKKKNASKLSFKLRWKENVKEEAGVNLTEPDAIAAPAENTAEVVETGSN